LAALSARPQPRDALLEVMRELVAEVRAMRADMAELRAALPIRRPRSERDQDLLRLLFDATRGLPFSVFMLLERIELNDAKPLREALVAELAEELSPKRVGKLLSRLSRCHSGDFILESAGRDRLGNIWRASSASANAQCHTAPSWLSSAPLTSKG
jgi:hypothetical protein